MAKVKRTIVIGGGQGGLSAAVHCRLHGDEVLLLEQNVVGGKAATLEQSGFKFDPGPSIIILPKIYKDVFRRAGRDPSDYLRFHRLDPITRVFAEGSDPFDIPADAERLFAVVDRISSHDSSSLRKLLSMMSRLSPKIEETIFQSAIHSPIQLLNPKLIAAGVEFAKYDSYKAYVDRAFESPILRAFFYGFPSYGGQSYDSKAMGSLMIPYFMLRDGVFYPDGGVGEIPNSFRRLANELGVEIRTGSKVIGLRHSGSRVVGVEIEGGKMETCDAVISNVDRVTVERNWLDRDLRYAPSFSYFTIHWGLNRKLRDTAHHMLLIPRGFESGFDALYRHKRFPEPPIVYLNVTSETDPSTASESGTNLFAVISSPACEPGLDWDKVQSRLRSYLIEVLAQHGWEIQPKDIAFERIQTPRYFESAHGNYLGSLYGPDEKHRLFQGMFPLKCRDDRIENLFYAGGSVQPGAGLPMVTLSGKFAADLVART